MEVTNFRKSEDAEAQVGEDREEEFYNFRAVNGDVEALPPIQVIKSNRDQDTR